MACEPLSVDGDFVTGALGFVDCQARTTGAAGYQALAAPGSIVAVALTGLLTLFVAGYGFRMLTGEAPRLRDGVAAFAKIAFVLALATGWGPYRTLVYDVAIAGPAELAGAIGGSAALPVPGELTDRLELVDKALIELVQLGNARPGAGQQDTRARQVTGSTQVVVEPAQGQPNPLEPFALAASRILFLAGAVGAIGAVRLVAGLLLALGPLFVAFALFDSTRGLFEGWVRGLVGAFLGGIAASLLLATELAASETWIADLLTRRLAEEPIAAATVELVVITAVFDLVLIAGLAASIRVASGFRLPRGQRPAAPLGSNPAIDTARVAGAVARPVAEERSRAWAVADGVAAMQRRERASPDGLGRSGSNGSGGGNRTTIVTGAGEGGSPDVVAAGGAVPLGQSFRRRPHGRVSASAGRRDGRA